VGRGLGRGIVFKLGVSIQWEFVERWDAEFQRGVGGAAGGPGEGQLEQRFETIGGGAKESQMEGGSAKKEN